jgi:hypothetical protein
MCLRSAPLVCLAILAHAFAAPALPHAVSIIVDGELTAPAEHGVAALTDALQAQGSSVERVASIAAAQGDRLILVRAIPHPPTAPSTPGLPTNVNAPESLSIAKATMRGKSAVLVTGADDRGLMYAALEVAEQIRATAPGDDPFRDVHEATEHAFVRDRTLSVYTMHRGYWESRFYDERYWTRYFDLLAASRFNHFLIVFGYENGGFLAPPYPYFFNTPGFPNVHMVGLSEDEQRKNLVALNRLIALAHDRGIAVSLGIWDHIYRGGVQAGGAEWMGKYKDGAIPNTVQGLTGDNLNDYTLASLKELLTRVPGIDGIQFRVHEESGLKREEMDTFWRAVFTEVRRMKPHLLVEARAKGTPDSVIATALDLGMNLRVETKYWMEQMGLPFHPTHINPENQRDRRHGYADLLRFPQRYQIDWRLWNGGTTRVLLWGDPEYVRRYSRSTQLYQSQNWDVQEPLATKMEAQPPEMHPFDLMPAKYRYYEYEFERYWAFYQMWGRIGYDPDVSPEVWQREFRRRFDRAGSDLADGLQRASQVLPMIVAAVYPYRLFPTTRGWAERQSLGTKLNDYAANQGSDTALFESFTEAAHRIATNGTTAKRTPDTTSRWFDATANAILACITRANAQIGQARGNEYDATITDLKILAQLARFHARRALAAVHYDLFQETHRPVELRQALAEERAAVGAWRELVAAAGDRYNDDLAMGTRDRDLCGHWRDELVGLETDLRDLEVRCAALPAGAAGDNPWSANDRADHEPPHIEHDRVTSGRPGEPLRLIVRVTDPSGVSVVRVQFRHLTQFEDYTALDLVPTGEPNTFGATIPGAAISADWGFMYYLEAIDRAGNGTTWPDPLKELPYIIVNVNRP